MKKLVYQYFRGNSAYHLKSAHSIQQYANAIDADYAFYDQPVPLSHYYGTLYPFLNDLYQDYDLLCYVDSDVLATKHCEDIFEYRGNGIGLSHMNTGPVFPEQKQDVSDYMRDYGASEWIDSGHGNAGVVLFCADSPKFVKFMEMLKDLNFHHKTASVRATHGHLPFGGYDQYILNKFNYENGGIQLPWKFNYHMARYEPQRRQEATLIHYHSNKRPIMQDDFDNQEFILK